MQHPENYPHQATYNELALENNLDPADIARAERAFGNDFYFMQNALTEPTPLEDIYYEHD